MRNTRGGSLRYTTVYAEYWPVSWLSRVSRGLRTILFDKQLPYTMQRWVDRGMLRVGVPTKRLRLAGCSITVRRCTSDSAFVETVFVGEQYFENFYRPGASDIIVDVGANIGTFALSAARFATDGRVIAIEPFPDNLVLLRENVIRNHAGNIEILSGAIGPKNGVTKLYLAGDNGMHSLKFDRGLGHISVATVTLQHIFKRYNVARCNFLKIDCEGAEFDFLPSLEPSVWKRIDRVAMECSVPIPDWRFGNPSRVQRRSKTEFMDSLARLLRSNGFHIDRCVDCAGYRAGYIFATNQRIRGSGIGPASP